MITTEIETAEADVCAASVVLRHASQKVLKLKKKLDTLKKRVTPTRNNERMLRIAEFAELHKLTSDAESAELAAEQDWESAVAALEFAEADAE